MPTYDYECSSCGHTFEVIQSISEDRLKKCPKCKKAKLERLIGSGSGIIFKGTGFYETDYKNKGAVSKDKKDVKPDSKPSTTPKPSGGCGSGCGCH